MAVRKSERNKNKITKSMIDFEFETNEDSWDQVQKSTLNNCSCQQSEEINGGNLLICSVHSKNTLNSTFACLTCKKNFRTSQNLQRHQLTHEGLKPFRCESCSKGFTTALSLEEHHYMHTGERPYHCPICDRSFRQTSSLQRHKLTHSPEVHSCKICNKTFGRAEYVRIHLLTHSQERQFPCSSCPKKFARRSDRNRHQRLHSCDRPYKCLHCSACYSDASTLRRHIQRHNEFPYACSICKHIFKLESQRNLHEAKHVNNCAGTSVDLKACPQPISSPMDQDTEVSEIPKQEELTTPRKNEESIDSAFVTNPNLNTQAYFDWLSQFTSFVCSLIPPIEVGILKKVACVHKVLVEEAAFPVGTLEHRDNYKSVFSTVVALQRVIQDHMANIINEMEET